MPKSKSRKNHKQKVANRNQKIVEQKNILARYQKQMMARYQEQILASQKEQIIESIIRNRPEIVTKTNIVDVDGNETWTYIIDNNNVDEKDGILYHKKDNNPLMAGLAQLEEYSDYNIKFVNSVLEKIAFKEKQSDLFNAEQVTDADLGIDTEFELIEDTSFETVSKTNETTKDDSMPDLGL